MSQKQSFWDAKRLTLEHDGTSLIPPAHSSELISEAMNASDTASDDIQGPTLDFLSEDL